MRVIKHDIPVVVDVDGTLLTLSTARSLTHRTNSIYKDTPCTIHYNNIQALKNHHLRGHHVTVWSKGGWKWALDVIKFLQLEHYVDEVRTKPQWCLDDLAPQRWMDVYHLGED